ncbi:DNA polymerase III subunit delta [Caldifermentibacillus hisashii]|uniref:DNA polymerase III subunit delta n=1 Tax=Caldifermentibacillus hisashii TaxID=996558 RepID=UPI001C0FAA93|nr:DNA polymerase III subunit delta [Caldifermentibacillus hisashii]MBU5342814.1 DNA polymerase III subunit delta [Caldifermentibacillus hisashii]
MVFLKIWKDIKKGKFSPLYLLYGNEDFLINETKKYIIDAALTEEEREFNLSIYDLEETTVESAVEDCQTIPFLGERKVVIMHNPYFLTAEKGKEKVDHNVKVFEEYIMNPVPSTILILIAPYKKLDERKKITKYLLKNAVVLEAKFSEKDSKDWIRQRITENGFEITPNAVELLYQFTGQNLTILNHELEKIFLYSDGKIIDEEMIQLLVPKSLENNIFVLVDKFVHQQLDQTLEIYHDLLKQNEEPIKILAVIASQIRFIAQVKSLIKQGYGEQKVARILRSHPYRVKLAISQANRFDEEKFLAMIDELADIDYQMKTGFGNKESLLEIFFFKYLT